MNVPAPVFTTTYLRSLWITTPSAVVDISLSKLTFVSVTGAALTVNVSVNVSDATACSLVSLLAFNVALR